MYDKISFFIYFFHYINCNDDEMGRLPGQDFDLNFKHYSGFLNINGTKFLHYWFVESQNDPNNDPLVFWYNGGPASSSIRGLLHEHGPYLVKKDVFGLRKNPDSWNTNANVAYMESPIGVGYSYGASGDDYQANDDYVACVFLHKKLTAQLNYDSIKEFLRKYSQFRENDLFVTGESYGGVYVPRIAQKILDGMNNFQINLKGIAVANGVVSEKIFRESNLLFVYGHGKMDDEKFDNITRTCCNGCVGTCDFETTEQCRKIGGDVRNLLFASMFNYDLYDQCREEKMNTMALMIGKNFLNFIDKKANPHEKRRYLVKNCLPEEKMHDYMNNKDVRKALHIPERLRKWDVHNETLHVQYIQKREMATYYKTIVPSGVRVLLFYGDTDLICHFLSGQKFAASLGFNKISNKTMWKVGDQIAGFKTVYKGLIVTTIIGTGHMSPQWRPHHVHYMINKFFKNEDF